MTKFTEYDPSRLYYFNVTAPIESAPARLLPNSPHTTNQVPVNAIASITTHNFLNTVKPNKACFIPNQIAMAKEAQALYRKLVCLSQVNLEHILTKILITNCPLTVKDARHALYIYDPNPASIKGRMVKRSGDYVPSSTPSALPSCILQHHKNALCNDLFFVNADLIFFHSISRLLLFCTINNITSCGKTALLQKLCNFAKYYTSCRFKIPNVHADGEFECLSPNILPALLNITTPDTHVGEVERSIQAIKEQARSTIHGLPYKCLPKLLI